MGSGEKRNDLYYDDRKGTQSAARDREIEIRRRRVFVMFLINLILVLFVGFELARSIWQADKPAVKISQRFVIIRALGLFSVLLFLVGMLVLGW